MSTNLNEKVLTTDSGLPISPITHAHSVVVNEEKRLDEFLQGIGTTDKELSETSTNPVENKAVYKEIKNIKNKILNENKEGTAGKVWGITSDGTPSWVSISGSSSDSLVNGLSYEYTNITTSKIIAGAGDLFDKQDQDFTILAKIKKLMTVQTMQLIFCHNHQIVTVFRFIGIGMGMYMENGKILAIEN